MEQLQCTAHMEFLICSLLVLATLWTFQIKRMSYLTINGFIAVKNA